jgi:hypothetical protein
VETLEGYLTGTYFRDKKDVEDIEQLLAKVCGTLVNAFRAGSAWPYEARHKVGLGTNPLSISTTAMILLSIIETRPHCRCLPSSGHSSMR